MTLIFNSEFIQSVNFFQLAEPGFIMKLLKNLHPQICMLGDSVFKADDISDKMYFIHHGQVEILCADDGQTVIAKQMKGSYFGEIGILITKRRTATVRAIITSILYTVDRDQFLEILD
jgi:CRP-like cAMP-binding protein